jgi:hypothetical protein
MEDFSWLGLEGVEWELQQKLQLEALVVLDGAYFMIDSKARAAFGAFGRVDGYGRGEAR